MNVLRRNWVTLSFIFLLILVAFLPLNFALKTDLYFSQDDFSILGYASGHSYLTFISDFLKKGEIFVPRRTIGYLLGYLNFKLLYDLFSINPLAFIANNHLIHTFNVVLLFLTIYKVTKKRFTAFFVSVIFNKYYLFYFINVHEYLAVFFCLLTILLFLHYPKRISLSLFTFVLALLSKQPAFALPFFLLYLAYFLRKDLKKSLKPFFIILGIYLFLQFAYYLKTNGTAINVSYETSYHLNVIFRNFSFYFNPKIFLLFLLFPIFSKKFGSFLVLFVFLLTLFPALILKNRQDFYYLYLPVIYLLTYIALNLPKISFKATPFFLIVIFLFGGRQAFPIIARQQYPNWQLVSIQNMLNKVKKDLESSPETAVIDFASINLERDARAILEYNVLNLFLDKDLGGSYTFSYDREKEIIEAKKIK